MKYLTESCFKNVRG